MVPNTRLFFGGGGVSGGSAVADRVRQGRLKNKGSIVYVV